MRLPRPLLAVGLFGCLAVVTCGSGGGSSPGASESAAIRPLDSKSEGSYSVVEEIRGVVVVGHGYGCAPGNEDEKGWPVRFPEAYSLPDYVTEATVIHQGFSLGFQESDEHVLDLGSRLENIEFAEGELRWLSSGWLFDGNYHNPFTYCYWFTTIGWNEKYVKAVPGRNVEFNSERPSGDYQMKSGERVVAATVPGWTDTALPTGFSARFEATDDQHLLQINNSWQAEPPNVQSRVRVHGKGLIKDDDRKPATTFTNWYRMLAQQHSDVGGAVGTLTSGNDPYENPFAERRGSGETCIDDVEGHGLKVESIPLNVSPSRMKESVAIPILFQWELIYGCSNHHVRNIGVHIDSIRYGNSDVEFDYVAELNDDSGNFGLSALRYGAVFVHFPLAISGGDDCGVTC